MASVTGKIQQKKGLVSSKTVYLEMHNQRRNEENLLKLWDNIKRTFRSLGSKDLRMFKKIEILFKELITGSIPSVEKDTKPKNQKVKYLQSNLTSVHHDVL
jgi:hypothetical protein